PTYGASMSNARRVRFKGIFPVAPTTFTERGELDLDSQKRCIDFMIDAGSNGICILANFSEQFVLADDERELLTRTNLETVAGVGGGAGGTTPFHNPALPPRNHPRHPPRAAQA